MQLKQAYFKIIVEDFQQFLLDKQRFYVKPGLPDPLYLKIST